MRYFILFFSFFFAAKSFNMAAPMGEKFEDVVLAILENISDDAVKDEVETFIKSVKVQQSTGKDKAER